MARFVRLESDPASAEVAVTVVDDWQGRGLGTALLDALADRAREESVTRFTGVALAENRDVLGLLGKLGAVGVVGHGPGTVELAVDLPAERVALERIEVRRGAALPEISSVIPGTELAGKPPPPRPASSVQTKRDSHDRHRFATPRGPHRRRSRMGGRGPPAHEAHRRLARTAGPR